MSNQNDNRSFIDTINPTVIALSATAIHHSLSARTTGEFKVQPKFCLGGGAQCKCDTTNINHMVHNACTDVFSCLDEDFHTSSTEIQAKKIDNIHCMIRQRIHSSGTDPAIVQPHNHQGSFDEDCLD